MLVPSSQARRPTAAGVPRQGMPRADEAQKGARMFGRMTAAVAAFLSLATGATAQNPKPDVKSEARPDAKQPAKPDPKVRKDEPVTLNLGDKAPALSVEEWI